MCGRFFVDPDDMSDEELIRLLDREKAKPTSEPSITLGEVRPGDCSGVIALNRRGERAAFCMKWGFRVNGRMVINARSETASEKPSFRQSMAIRRCLIPASAYFEWDHRVKPLQKYRFHSSARRMIYLAGLYRFEEDPIRPVFTILTREAAPEIACFHDRMPVIVPPERKNDWLDRNLDSRLLLPDADTLLTWKQA